MSTIEWKYPREDFGRQTGKTTLQAEQMWKWLYDAKVVSLETAFGVKLDEIGDSLEVERNPCSEIFLGDWLPCTLVIPVLEEITDDWTDDLVLES